MKNEEFMYDDDKALAVILNHISPELKSKASKDDILLVLDIELDFYEMKGFLESDGDDYIVDVEDGFDFDELVSFIVEELKVEEVSLTEDDVAEILEGEAEYLRQNGVIDDEE